LKNIEKFIVLDYPMLGINKPITATGCFALHPTELLDMYTLFHLFDPEIELPIDISYAGGLCVEDLFSGV